MKKNIFVVGLDDFNLQLMQAVRGAENYAFHTLLPRAEIASPRSYPMGELLERARAELRRFPGSVHAIIGHWDFPTTTLVQMLREEWGLPTPSLEAVLRCEHKYWSRLLQQEIMPAHTPRFAAFDPFAVDPLRQIGLDFPFWVKPVKAHSSNLGFRIDDEQDFERALRQVRAGIGRFAEPFNYVLNQADLPPSVRPVDGYYCLAEEITAGRQLTLEGYMVEGEGIVYGAVDSFRAEGCSSFNRYQYPSTLPEWLLRYMADASSRLMERIGLDNAPFNIEWFYDEEREQAWVLEVNPRISKSHAPLFELVDSASHHEVAIDLALKQRPSFPRHSGRYSCAAKFMLRERRDGVAVRTPTAAEIAAIEREVPGTRIQLSVEDGMRLSDLQNQDSYSYEVAVIFVGGHDEAELLQKYQRCVDALPFEYAYTDADQETVIG